jgi:Protein of unknown function (DUF3105)
VKTPRSARVSARSIARWQTVAGSAWALAAACSPTGAQRPYDAGPFTDAAIVIAGDQCVTTIQQQPDEGYLHVPCVEDVTYQTNPPSSGNHYPCWAAYQTYDAPIPWGNLVHSLEHGAIVIVYDCADGCPDDVAAIQTFMAGLPLDADCGPSLGKDRLILMPDPDLDVRFAASAWGWTLKADCFDPTAFRQFFDDHYDHGREIICSDGWTGAGLCSACPYD